MPGEITPAQIKRIHTLKGAMQLTDLQYRAALEQYHVFSSKQLTEAQADQLVCEMENVAVSMGKWERAYRKYQPLDGRKGMASARQLRLIEAMWFDVSRAPTAAVREAALLKFLRRFGVNSMADVRWYDVPKIINALTAMKQEAK